MAARRSAAAAWVSSSFAASFAPVMRPSRTASTRAFLFVA